MHTHLVGKRSLDLISAVALSVIFLPIWLLVPLLIKLNSRGPVFYTQTRVGRDGVLFRIYKFRSMIANADEYIEQHAELLKKFKEGDWKLEHDPRITGLGKLLRRLTIDEMPQIYNVLKGEMSLVGPRAYRPEEIKYQLAKHPDLEPLIKQLLQVKPGITGPWQTTGRNDIGFRERAMLDAQYAQEWSLFNDIKIILKTPMAMISRW